MCLLAILWRVVDDAPLVVAANREEAYARGGTPPQLNHDKVPFIAGLDPMAGGTWLGVNAHSVLIAVTNRRGVQAPHAPRSRGLLVRDLLQFRTASEAEKEAIQQLSTGRYASCNLFIGDCSTASVLHAGEWLRHRPLSPGFHVLTAGDLNDETDERAIFALKWLESRPYHSMRIWLSHLRNLCGYGGQEGGPSICLHSEKGGTVSSSIVVLRNSLSQCHYWHCQGPPDTNPYKDVSHFFTNLR